MIPVDFAYIKDQSRICLLNLTAARHGASQSQSRAKRVKHLGEWFEKQRNQPVPVTKNENTAPIGRANGIQMLD